MRSLIASPPTGNGIICNGSTTKDWSSSEDHSSWNFQDSMDLYHVNGWGFPYFFINSNGNMSIRPHGRATDSSNEIDLTSVIEKLVTSGMSLPMIIRFPEILNDRLHELQSAFERAMAVHNYKGSFQGVFPVKCNPDRYLIEDIVSFGSEFAFGLEAGSKAELLLAMATLCKSPSSSQSLLICNGYKDSHYINIALVARQLGLNSVIVVEEEDEVDMVMKMSSLLNIRPVIGIRAKLSTKHDGHWGDTSGDHGKFGLSPSQIVNVTRKLRRAGMADCLQLLHFHVGSQIPSIAIVSESVTEAAHIFCDLNLMGANMKVIDIGGGLGIDYDGSSSPSSHMSVEYSIGEYADAVIQAVDLACTMKKVKRPVVCCESGRGLVSHHSVLVFDIFSVSGHVTSDTSSVSAIAELCDELDEYRTLPEQVRESYDELVRMLKGEMRETSHVAACDLSLQLKHEFAKLFKLGLVSLEMRASIEKANSILQQTKKKKASGDVATYHMNVSIFKAMPDSWGIGQVFPIMPLQRLNEEPKVAAILSDITCDSDGRICSFIGGGDVAVHDVAFDKGERYYMGMFLGGAYQEALSSMHNLFGGMNVVHVASSGGGGFRVTKEVKGQSVGSVVRVACHDPNVMMEVLREKVVKCMSEGRLDECEARGLVQLIVRSLTAYTYLER